MVKPFDLFIGVDWSGAKGPRLPGLQVAKCDAKGRVGLVANPAGGAWSRTAFASWLADQIQQDRRIVCGIDFSFCFPWVDQQAYFPGVARDPPNPAAFWEKVEEVCADDEGFYGGRLADTPPYDSYFHHRGRRGGRYERRLRVAEARTQEQGLGAPESVFNLVGARQVGKSSLAGMRFLRAMKRYPGVAVWPFDEPTKARLVFVETFPTAFVRMAGESAGKVRDRERLLRVLGFFDAVSTPSVLRDSRSAPSSARTEREAPFAPRSPRQRASRRVGASEMSDDEADALITAAALRSLAPQAQFWHPPGMSDIVRRTEGWTFGVL